jgi:hypothetical protein
MRILRCALFSTLIFLCVTSSVLAQQIAGNITGRVTDASGGVIPGVTVTLKSAAIQGEPTAVTDEAGNYRFLGLPPGTFTLTYGLPGFKTLVRADVIVDVGKTTTINPAMEVATTAETVTVTGESPVVDVTAATVGINYDQNVVKKHSECSRSVDNVGDDSRYAHHGRRRRWLSHGTVDWIPVLRNVGTELADSRRYSGHMLL